MGRTETLSRSMRPVVADPAARGWRRLMPNLTRQAPRDAGGSASIDRRHIYILPTGAGLVLGATLALMLLGSLNYQNNLGLLFTFLLGSVAIVGMHHTWFNLLGLNVSVRGGAPVFAGQEASFVISFGDDRVRRRGGLVARSDRAQTQPVQLERGGSTTVGIHVPTRRRGYCTLDPVRVQTVYPLGLFRAWCYAQTDARVLVYPRPAPRAAEPHLTPAFRQSSVGDLGVGADDFVGPRDYRPGDSPRQLDWKALARERGLIVKQFGGDRAVEVWIDWARLPTVDEEQRLSLLCRQVVDAAEQDLSFGLRLPGQTVTMGHGDAHKHRCLEALAGFGHG